MRPANEHCPWLSCQIIACLHFACYQDSWVASRRGSFTTPFPSGPRRTERAVFIALRSPVTSFEHVIGHRLCECSHGSQRKRPAFSAFFLPFASSTDASL